jgi:hypothetical protein
VTEINIELDGIQLNLSPDAFHMWATHYYKCKQDFNPRHKFSPVPYFLLCRAIELELKSKHLPKLKQKDVKNIFSHDLIKAYNDLNPSEQTLTDDELIALSKANEIYKSKGFEYFVPKHALRGYSVYPDLEFLDLITSKLIGETT